MRWLIFPSGSVRGSGCAIAIVAFLRLSSPAGAFCVDYSQSLHFIGAYASDHGARSFAYRAEVGYLGLVQGLDILDLSDPSHPSLLGRHALWEENGVVNDVALAGGRACLAEGDLGLDVVNVTDPSHPVRISRLATIGWAGAVESRAGYAYVCEGVVLGIARVDVTAPVWVGSVAAQTDIKDVFIEGNRAFVIDGVKLRIFDLSSPEVPAEIGSLGLPASPGGVTGVAVSGGLAVVSGFGLFVLDVSNPAAPMIRSSLALGWTLQSALAGSTAFVGTDWHGLSVYDLSNPMLPVKIGQSASFSTRCMALDGEVAYVLHNEMLRVLDISPPTSPQPAGVLPLSIQTQGVAVAGSLAYLAATDLGLHVVDISDPAQPRSVSLTATQGVALELALSGNHVFVGQNSGLRSVDISDPSAPVLRGSVPGTMVEDVFVSGPSLYMIEAGALDLVDISDPANPALRERNTAVHGPHSVAAQGDHAYVGGEGILEIVALSGPPPHPVVGTLPLPQAGWVNGVAVRGNYVFLAGQSQFVVADVSDPAAPFVAAAIPTGTSAWDLTLDGSYACVTARVNGVQIFDISDPVHPAWIGGMATPEHAWGIAVAEQVLVVTDGITYTGNSLQLIPRPCEPGGVASPTRLTGAFLACTPNPFQSGTEIGYRLAGAGWARLAVFDAGGRRVRALETDRGVPAGIQWWNATDDAGRRLPPGVYWVRLESARGSSSRPVVLIR